MPMIINGWRVYYARRKPWVCCYCIVHVRSGWYTMMTSADEVVKFCETAR